MADSVSSVTQQLFDQYAVQPQVKSPTKDLGKNDFLKLLTTQMKYQDPTQPMDNKDMAAQLAQFSSLEQLQNLNTSMDNLTNTNASLATSLAQMSLPAMISKNITANSNSLHFDGSNTMNFAYNLQTSAQNVHVEIQNANGQVVRSWDTPDAPTASGDNSFSWDGKNNNGAMQPNGNYTFVVTAKDAQGNEVTSTPVIHGKVTAVRYTGTTAYLVVNGAEVPVNTVTDVGE